AGSSAEGGRREGNTAPAVAELSVTIAPDTLCKYNVVAVKSDVLNAWADGEKVVVTSAMLRFAADDDELAVVLSHEIAHNAMRHLDARIKNTMMGAIVGAILDVAVSTGGADTQWGYTRRLASAGSQAFSQDFEREADYVGLYILARAQRPYASAPDFWR